MTRTRLSLALLALAAAVAPAFAQTDPEAALNRRIPEVAFDATPLGDALDTLRDTAGINLRVDWKALENAGVDRAAPVTFRLRNVTVRKALDMLLREAGAGTKLAYEIDDGLVEVTTQEVADARLVTMTYDVRDLLFRPLDAGAPPQLEFQLEPVERGGGGGGGGNLFPGAGGQGQGAGDVPPAQRGQELVELITSSIRPDIWNVNGGPASVRFFNGLLIITAPRSVHDLIGTPVQRR